MWLVVFVITWLITIIYATWQAWKLLKEPRQKVTTVVRKMQKEQEQSRQ